MSAINAATAGVYSCSKNERRGWMDLFFVAGIAIKSAPSAMAHASPSTAASLCLLSE